MVSGKAWASLEAESKRVNGTSLFFSTAERIALVLAFAPAVGFHWSYSYRPSLVCFLFHAKCLAEPWLMISLSGENIIL